MTIEKEAEAKALAKAARDAATAFNESLIACRRAGVVADLTTMPAPTDTGGATPAIAYHGYQQPLIVTLRTMIPDPLPTE